MALGNEPPPAMPLQSHPPEETSPLVKGASALPEPLGSAAAVVERSSASLGKALLETFVGREAALPNIAVGNVLPLALPKSSPLKPPLHAHPSALPLGKEPSVPKVLVGKLVGRELALSLADPPEASVEFASELEALAADRAEADVAVDSVVLSD